MRINSKKVYDRFFSNVQATQPDTPSAFLELFALFAEALEIECEAEVGEGRPHTRVPLFPVDEDADTDEMNLCHRCGASMHQDANDKAWFCYGCERFGG